MTVPDLYLDPELRPLLEGFALADFDDTTVRETRALTRPVFESLPRSEAVEHSDHVVDQETGAVVRVHRPLVSSGPRPALVWMHGGGFVIGSHLMDGPRLDRLATEHGIVVVSVGYRLAPEAPFPAAHGDCRAAFHWTAAHASLLGVDPARIGIGGSSAGGGLAAALALRLRDDGTMVPAFQMLEAPMLDDRAESDSIQRDDLHIWTRQSNAYAWAAYLGDLHGSERISPYAAAARADDLSELPPTLVIVGSADGLRDETLAYGQRLLAAGVPTELHVMPGAPHGVGMFAGTGIATRWEALVDAWLQAQVGAP